MHIIQSIPINNDYRTYQDLNSNTLKILNNENKNNVFINNQVFQIRKK